MKVKERYGSLTDADAGWCVFFRLQQNRMLQQSLSRPISRMHSAEQCQKETRLRALLQEVEYLHPRKHRYFCKAYRIDPDVHQIPLLLRDMEEYRQLLSGQTQKIVAYLHDYLLDPTLNTLLTALLKCYQEFGVQGGRMAGRLGKREEPQGRKEPEGKCSECLRVLSEYRVEQMREELQLNRFEDHYNLFNVDHLNFNQLGRLQRESKALLQGEMAEENQFVYQGGCISLEQYEEVLNLLGSDLHQKNASIQKIIDYLNKTDKRLLGENPNKDRQDNEELRRFEALVAGDSIQQRLKEMIRQFFKRYLKYKMYKRKDEECQVNFKENDVIRQLEREKKHLKNRIYTITTQRERMAIDYQNRLKSLNTQLQANATQFREQMERNAIQASQTAQLFAEERHLHDLHKIELQHLTTEYTHVLALLNRKSINPKETSNSPHSSRSKRGSSRKSKKEKPKIPSKRQRSSFAELASMNVESEKEIQSGSNLLISKAREGSKKSIYQTIRSNNSTLNEMGRTDGYSKIDQRQEEEENEVPRIVHREMKRKTSRFKALMSHFNSNVTLQQEASTSQIEKTNLASLNAITHQTSNEEQLQPCLPEQTCKQSEQSRYEMLLRLFQSERSTKQLTLPFPSFLQLYNDFITTISSQKLLRRSSSLKPRVSRLGSNYQKTPHSRTAKSIDEQLTKQNGNKAKHQRSRQSSKLQPIEKKSQYFLKKVRKSKQFQFKNYSRTAENTLRKDHSQHLISIKDVQIESEKQEHLYACFTDEDFQELFLGQANATRVESEGKDGRQQQPSPAQNRLLMKVYAQMASLHIKNTRNYQEVRTVLCHPKEAVARQAVSAPRKENVNELKNALRCVIKLHRKCKKDKGKTQCRHIQKFLAKIGLLCNGTSIKVIDNMGCSQLT